MADQASKHEMIVAVEPQGNPEDLWVTYLDGLQILEELDRSNVKLHGDVAHMLQASEPLEDLCEAPETLVGPCASSNY
jgi:sugar phosphate isomerase/epimerase